MAQYIIKKEAIVIEIAKRKNIWIPAIILALFAGLLSAFYLTQNTFAANCPCSLWSEAEVPSQLNIKDDSAVELGVKFRPASDGQVTGVRFFKSEQNTGTHTGSLWSEGGARLAEVTFTDETASGWQQASFSAPVEVSANTVYVVSYHSPTGNYSATQNYFTEDRGESPLTAPAAGSVGGNGVYAYGFAGTFPNQSYNSTNYWVDAVFDDGSEPDTTPPTVASVTPAANATNVAHGANITAVLSENVAANTINSNTVELRQASGDLVASSVSYNQANNTITINPDANLSANTQYTVTLKGGESDPRIKDQSGNALVSDYVWSFTASDNYCGDMNEIACENTRPGTPASQWDIGPTAGDPSIQGFSTDISVNRGNTIKFKIKTPSTDYSMDIYRLGYYNGDGARKVATVTPTATLPQSQPECLSEASTGLIDCGNWAESASWNVPADAVSGMYVARLNRHDATGSSHILFTVRNDASTSDLFYQTSDTTWGGAYSDYGGNNLYAGSPVGRAYKVSYNKPITTRGTMWYRTNFFANEQPMVRWLEANGYDISYTTGVDTDRQPASVIQQHKVFISSGHDEYWSADQRAKVEAARDAGVHLAFFSGNEVFWKTRWEDSIDGSGTSHRTLVSYKESKSSTRLDPTGIWTGTWRDPRFSPPSDGGRPENSLTGQIFTINCCVAASIQVPEEAGKLRFWRNTSVANQQIGATATLTPGTVGFEADEDLDNGFRPAGLIRMSHTPLPGVNKLQDFGDVYANGSATHSISLYKAPSGALVFGAGTVRWSWGLDGTHDDSASSPGSGPDLAMKQATVNLFADMDSQPTTLQPGLTIATKSTDTTAPTSTITSPADEGTVQAGDPIIITGTASDVDGRVGGVEVSTDGGATWRRAEGRDSWTYTHTFSGSGEASIMSRAADDSGNIEMPGEPTQVTIQAATTLSVFSSSSAPAVQAANDADAIEVGMKFKSDVDGQVSGVRFYKGLANTGEHVGNLWKTDGTNLGRVTFTGESASGWQQANFETPIDIEANTTYIVSYYAPNGGYSLTAEQFALSGVSNAPLHALSNAESGGNAVFFYGVGGGFPNQTYNGSNYWVDLVFSPGEITPDTEAPSVPADLTATANSSNQVTLSWSASSDNKGVTGYRIYRDGVQIDTSVSPSYTDSTVSADTNYTYAVRAVDAAGNISDLSGEAIVITPSANNNANSLTIFSPDATPAEANISDGTGMEFGMKFKSDVAGQVTGVRFYKGSNNTGTHVGSLWSSTGTQLASVTFTDETASGWQQANFSTPVDIEADTTYIVSYYSPDGNFSATWNQLANSRISNAPLHALSHAESGGNGVFGYGEGSVFPTQSNNGGNYWVDVVFSAGEVTPDTEAPSTPSNLSASATSATQVNLSWTASSDNIGVTGYRIYRDGAQVGTSSGANYIDKTVSANTEYTYTVRAVDAAQNLSAVSSAVSVTTPASTSSTVFSPSDTPAITVNEPQAVELGMKFRSDKAGKISGVRFYKDAANTGIHTGNLWAANGTLLASVEFTDETASGWQQANFSTPVDIEADTTYIVSYYAPNGNYSATGGYFATDGKHSAPLHGLASGIDGNNGVFKYGPNSAFPDESYNNTNYWVDVVYQPHTEKLFADTDTPDFLSVNESLPVELGMKFTSSVDGNIAGIRFYKDTSNTGTHIGNLWSLDGTNLGSVTFTDESASGWQQANFASPIAIQAGAVYTISYFAPNGNYSYSSNYFTEPKTSDSLTALSGGNGVYKYNPFSSFPNDSFNNTNYWVDPVFEPGS